MPESLHLWSKMLHKKNLCMHPSMHEHTFLMNVSFHMENITHAGMPEQLKSGHLGASAGGVMASKAPLAGSAKSGRSNREPEPSCQRSQVAK